MKKNNDSEEIVEEIQRWKKHGNFDPFLPFAELEKLLKKNENKEEGIDNE